MEYAPDWMRALEPRELAQVYHALAYAKDFSAAGVPGHSQHMLIAKLAGLLDSAMRDLDSNTPPMFREGTP